MLLSVRVFNGKKHFKNKRIAIVGAADSVFEVKNGGLIDSYDIVIRINKAAITWDGKNSGYLGAKFTYLFHSFYENDFSGGGKIDFQKFQQMGVEKIINPNFSFSGLKTQLNFYKRHLRKKATYILTPKISGLIRKELEGYIPTIGFSALITLLKSNSKEIYITGFTFFKTPYAEGYRKRLTNPEDNKKHLEKQGIHNPDLEFKIFKKYLKLTSCSKVKLDNVLNDLIQSEQI